MQGIKVREVFPDMVVLKSPKRTRFFSDLTGLTDILKSTFQVVKILNRLNLD